jgi:LysM repeat protein
LTLRFIMKFKFILFTIALFTISFTGFTKPLIDSVGVKNNDGKKMVLFKVKAKDTYYSIGHRYNIKPEVLMKFNGKKKAILSIGTVVEVPTDMPFKKSKKEEVADAPAKETKKEKKERLALEEKEAHDAKKHKKENAEEEQPAAPAVVTQPVAAAPVKVEKPAEPAGPITTQYKVSAHETMYGISKRFNMSVDELVKANNLHGTTLSPGQILMVRSGAPAQEQKEQPQVQPPVSTPAPAPIVRQAPTEPVHDTNVVEAPAKDSSSLEHHMRGDKFGLYEKNEKGVATWIDDTSLDPTKKLVLHRFAPVGTVIKITNPMTNRTTFAKVVGRFTDNEATKDVIIVMTKNVADALGAYDKRFRVNISYGSPNE